MIVVTGTRRSGTSMWMQVLEAAGVPVVGDKFPLDWSEMIAPVNPRGFYESTLRDGIYFATNPDPRSGEYLHPADARMHAVKIFPEGLVRTELTFLDRVLVTVRPWREYAASIDRLLQIEGQARGVTLADRPPRLSGALEWWGSNFALVRDLVMRRYAVHMQSYASVLADPAEVVPKVLDWLADAAGSKVPLNVAAAVEAVHPELRGFEGGEADAEVEDHIASVFDRYYESIHERGELGSDLLDRMNEIQTELAPRYTEHQEQFTRWLAEHATSARAAEPLSLDPGDGPQ